MYCCSFIHVLSLFSECYLHRAYPHLVLSDATRKAQTIANINPAVADHSTHVKYPEPEVTKHLGPGDDHKSRLLKQMWHTIADGSNRDRTVRLHPA